MVAPISAASGHRFFFATTAGQVYAIEATRQGRVIWSAPLGEPFFDPILLDGSRIFLRSTFGNLFELDVATGISLWDAPRGGVGELIGVSAGYIFIKSLAGGFAALDSESGKTVREIRSLQPARVLANDKTDRLYLISDRGTLQCLRPVGSALPVLKQLPEPVDPLEVAEDQKDEDDELDVAETTPEMEAGNNPFGADDDGGMFGDDSGGNLFGGDDDGGSLFGDSPF